MMAVAVALVGLIAAPAAFAGKGGGKGKRGDAAPTTAPSDTYAKYDKNSNATLEADEKDALRKDFEADKTGPLKVWDTNNDGKLGDDEIAAIPATKAVAAPVKEKKHKKQK